MIEESQLQRYSRQLLLPEIGGVGQERLLSARVDLRVDGLAGETLRSYLDAAGVGFARGGLVVSGPRRATGARWVLDELGVAWAGRQAGPCGDCLAASLAVNPRPPDWARAAVGQAAGAMAAAQILLALAGHPPETAGAYLAWPHAEQRPAPSRPGCRCA